MDLQAVVVEPNKNLGWRGIVSMRHRIGDRFVRGRQRIFGHILLLKMGAAIYQQARTGLKLAPTLEVAAPDADGLETDFPRPEIDAEADLIGRV